MVVFDIKLLPQAYDASGSHNVAKWSPDIAQVVNFGPGDNSRPIMKQSTQSIIAQNYEIIKQSMLAAADSSANGTLKPAFRSDTLKTGGPFGSSLF